MPDITDNDLTINPGTGGAAIKTDYVAGSHVQVVKVAYGTSSQAQRVDATHPFPVKLTDSSGSDLSVTASKLDVNISAASPLNVNVSSQTAGAYLAIIGVSGGTAVGITASDLDIRGLSAGNMNGLAPSDSITVIGASGGFPVAAKLMGGFTAIGFSGDALKVYMQDVDGATVIGITAGNFNIRGISAGNLYSGTGPNDTITVVGVSGGYPVGITASNLHTRSLSMGTPSSGTPSTYDGVRVAGYTGAYPVNAAAWGMSGGTPFAVGVTAGDRLKVDIGAATFSGTVNVGAAVGISGDVAVKGATAATTPVWVAGGTVADAPITVKGSGTFSAVRVEGVTGGAAVGITASNLQIRGLTASDFVGLTGAAYLSLSHLETQLYKAGYPSLPEFLFNILNLTLTMNGNIKSGNVTSPGLLEALRAPLQSSNFNPSENAIRAEVVNSGSINVNVATVAQPTDVSNGTVSATTTKAACPSFVMKSGVMLKSKATNTATVYIGKFSSLTTANGFSLEPGEQHFIEADQLSLFGVIAASGTQDVRFIAS